MLSTNNNSLDVIPSQGRVQRVGQRCPYAGYDSVDTACCGEGERTAVGSYPAAPARCEPASSCGCRSPTSHR